MAASGTMSQVGALLQARRYGEAARRLTAAAAAGEPDALAELAQWRIAGDIVRRDLAAARALLSRAGGAGHREAALLHASFLASGTGGPDDWTGALAALAALAPREPRAAAQLRLLAAMDLGVDGFPAHPLEGRELSAAPYVVAADAFVTEAEGAYLKEKVGPSLQPSVVVDPATGRMVPNPVRRSDGAVFGVFAEDLVVNAINRRIAALSGTALAQGEPLQLLRYRPGDEYRPHLDALPAEPNQRILTVLLYLSDGYEGGETCFPRTGLSFQGRRGDALLFRNVAPDLQPDPMAIHAGLPVRRGVKFIGSRWIRERPFIYPPPRPIVDL
jgi:prolyl 4-hydroxylase